MNRASTGSRRGHQPRATRDDWEIKPLPAQRARLDLARTFYRHHVAGHERANDEI
ncbi:MAG: hypothetical protein ACP5GX_07790 [Anaerolineae bacterium]